MRKIISIVSLIGCCSVFAAPSNENLQKHVVFVKLDENSQKAHEQLANLKDMDVLGVNFKKHEAEVYVTAEELQQLKAANLNVFSKLEHEKFLETAVTGYLNPTQVREALTTLNQKYPQLTKVFEIGKTHRNLPIMAVEISSNPGDLKRPVIVFNAMHHAREVMTTEVVMHIANVLTDQYGKSGEITNWLDQYRIVMIPQVNPDGNALVHAGQTMWRKNAYTVSGMLAGVDLNRNYPAYWNYCQGSSGSSFSETFRGPSAGSEPEVQAVMKLMAEVKPVASISYHSYSELIIYPFACSNVVNPSKQLFHKIALDMKAAIRDDNNKLNTYQVGTTPELLYNADGSDDDWLWKEQGVLAYTIEVNSNTFRPDYNAWRNNTVKRQEGGWMTLIRKLQSSGFHAFVQSENLDQVTYSLKKSVANTWVEFDADDNTKKFPLRSKEGLLYQLTEPGTYAVSFYKGNAVVKTMTVTIADQNVDLGTLSL